MYIIIRIPKRLILVCCVLLFCACTMYYIHPMKIRDFELLCFTQYRATNMKQHNFQYLWDSRWGVIGDDGDIPCTSISRQAKYGNHKYAPQPNTAKYVWARFECQARLCLQFFFAEILVIDIQIQHEKLLLSEYGQAGEYKKTNNICYSIYFSERGENMHRCTYMHTKAHMPQMGGDGDSIIWRRCGLCENMQHIFHIYCLLRMRNSRILIQPYLG